MRGSAFRARRYFDWPLQRLRSRYGELPRHALPGKVPATDSAVAPRRVEEVRPFPAAPKLQPDPDYEKRLEALAQSMLSGATETSPTVPPARSAETSRPSKADEKQPGASAHHGQARTEQAAPVESAPLTRRPAPTATRRALPYLTESDSHGRREPVLDPLPGITAPESLRAPSHGLRHTAIAGAMVAVVLGLSVALWISELDELDRSLALTASARDSSARAAASTVHGDSGTEGQLASGTAQPPLAMAGPPQDEASTPLVVTPLPSPAIALQEDPPADVPEPGYASSAAPKLDTEPAAPSTAEAPTGKVNPAEADKAAIATVDARKGKTGAKKSDARRTQQRGASSRSAQVAAAKSVKKPAVPAAPRDDDIDRLRSQAYSESSRDRERKLVPKSNPVGSSTTVAVTPISTASGETRSHKKELAQCAKLDGLFYRERCKWRICKDQWGNNGCPSYPQPDVNP